MRHKLSGAEKQRQNCIQELITTEETYNADMSIVLEVRDKNCEKCVCVCVCAEGGRGGADVCEHVFMVEFDRCKFWRQRFPAKFACKIHLQNCLDSISVVFTSDSVCFCNGAIKRTYRAN